MDLVTIAQRPTDPERVAVDAVAGPPVEFDGRVSLGGHAARARRHLLLPALHAVRDATGAVSRGALGYICDRLSVPPAEAYGVATFYALFRVDEDGADVTYVCDDIVCSQYGATDLLSSLDGSGITFERSPCLGQCDRAPAAMVHRAGRGYGISAPADGSSLASLEVADLAAGPIRQDRSDLRILRRVGAVDPGSLAEYVSSGGFAVLRGARESGADRVIHELKASNLRGRGGAAFPMGEKWDGLRRAEGDVKYVIANGDESEPGTFKDRLLMEGDPYAVVEAMAVYGFVTGASHGYVYVRGEYPTAARLLMHAIDESMKAGYLGDELSLEVRRGAGAYICGEETALFASIEGHRGEPRQKPPFPTEVGVFGRPTGINNIETLLAALEVLTIGGAAFAEIGTDRSTGPKLFCVTGAVARPGVYEVPFGTTLGELVDLAGGSTNGVGAILTGGAAGVFVDQSALTVPLTFEDAAAAGISIGSGSIIVFGSETDFAPVLSRIARFFREESCGQCVPCRLGTIRQEEILERLASGAGTGIGSEDRRLLDDLASVMTDASICGLGQTAALAIQSAMRLGLRGAPA